MKILFLTDNFPPEGNAPASRTYEHAIQWVRAGHQVTVITGAPNYPEGKLFPGYRNEWYGVEDMDGIRVVRVKTYIKPNEGFLGRILDFTSFMVSSFFAGLMQKRPDVIVGTSPQFFTVCSAWMLSVFRARPFVFELRDLWPASIKAVGFMSEGRTYRVLERLEMFLYRRAAAIVAVTHAFKSELVERGIDGRKLAVVVNGVDLQRYQPRARDQALAAEYDLQGKFVVGYIGTQGMAHALHVVLEAADLLRDRPEIVFVLAGCGAQNARLLEQAQSMGLENVRFIPRQPKERMPAVWSVCDVSLIQLRNYKIFESVIPSKIFESMGMGLPIVLGLPSGEASGIIEDTGAGILIAPEQPEQLAAAAVRLFENPDERAVLAIASHAAAPLYARERQAGSMMDVLSSVAANAPIELAAPVRVLAPVPRAAAVAVALEVADVEVEACPD